MSFVKTAVALRPKDVEKKVRWLVGIMLVMWITSTTLEAQQFIIVPLPPTKSGFLPANRGMHTIPNRKYVSRIRSKGRGYPIPGIPGKIRKNPFVVPLKAEVKIPPERRYAAWLKIYDR